MSGFEIADREPLRRQWWRFSDAGRDGGARGTGPAYGNRPSTNPRGTGATLWGFENSGAAVEVARWLRDAIC